MSVVYIAYANGSVNDLGPADAGISIFRKDVAAGQVMDERQIAEWTGTEIDDEDGDLDEEAAERQLGYLGWRLASSWKSAADGQLCVEVEPFGDGRPVRGL